MQLAVGIRQVLHDDGRGLERAQSVPGLIALLIGGEHEQLVERDVRNEGDMVDAIVRELEDSVLHAGGHRSELLRCGSVRLDVFDVAHRMSSRSKCGGQGRLVCVSPCRSVERHDAEPCFFHGGAAGVRSPARIDPVPLHEVGRDERGQPREAQLCRSQVEGA